MSRLIRELSSFPSTASTSQEDHASSSESTSSRKLRVTLLSSEWRSTKGGLSTINRELAIQLAKHPSVEVSVYLPQCSEEDKRVAASHNVQLIEAEEMEGYDPVDWLSFLPENHSVDCVIGHGAILGRQVQGIKRHCNCKWIQVVHTAPEELGTYKSYADAISKGEKKHQAEVKLCEKADQVVAVGPKLAEASSGYLRACGKDQNVLNLTPGVFSEFADVKQATEERKTFSVLVFGRGDNEDFQLKGYDIAARAIAELKDEPQPYKLLFVGAPSGEEEKVADLLLEQGIDRNQLTVRCFDERREQLAQLFREVDLAIMPSRTEGFGLAALEALSAGLPVLVSENSGLGEALKKVSFGSYFVVKSENPEAWASAIRIIREKDREIRLDESKTLREKYAIKHNWQDQCNRLIEIMRNISQEGLQPVKKGKRPLPPSGVPDPKHPRLPREGESCPTAPVDCRKDFFSDNQCVAEEEQAHGHSVLSENLDIQIDAVEQGGASPSQNVSGKENVVDRRGPSSQELLNGIVDDYRKAIHPPNLEKLNGFLQFLERVRQAIVVDVKTGSLIITVRCTSLRILDDLWKDYCTGHLQQVAQRYLVTEDILQQLGLDSVQLTLTISEEEYKAYRNNFLKYEGIFEPVANTSLPDDLRRLPLDAVKTEGEQTLPTDATPTEFCQDLSPPYKASTSQEGKRNSSSSPSSKELRAISLKGSKEGKRPLTSSSTLASKSPKTLGDEETASQTSATNPPQVIAHQIRNKDLPAKSKPFGDCQIQVDILLLTVMKKDTCEDCEFLSCLAHLNPGFCKVFHPDLGYVYLGDMGENDLKLNVAVMKCYEGSSSTGGSIVVVINAVKVLKPKAVFCVGSCSGLNVTKVSLGDVVVLKKLVTYAFSKVTENGIEELGVKVPLKPHLSKLILGAGAGWKPPLKDPGALEVKIHRGTFLSGPEVINNHKRCNALIERFPEAVAIEREGVGLFAAAHDLDIEWVVIKGISGYADGRKVKDSWRAFASFMAASLTAHILSDTIAFQALPHYGSASSKTGKRPLSPSSTPASKVPKCLGDEDRDSLVIVKLLKKEYKRRSHLRPLLWDSTIQLPIEQVYTRLKIVSRGKLISQIKDDDVKVFDIFKVPDIGEDVMTIVEGSPGIGKTTFCLKLAYDWAHGNIPSECSFPKFEFVFLLKCRDIDGDIMKAISEQLLPRDMDMEKSVEKLLHLMKDIHNQERLVLIILDGLDELPEQSRRHVDELLHRRILPFCYVLATTRQERGIEVRKSVVFDIHLEIKGYTESDSIAYVRRHFETIGQSPKGERLIEEMQQNTFLHALRNNPLNLLLLCVVYEDCEGKLPTSRTELYQVIVQCLLRRYCAKRNLSVPEIDSTLEKMFEKEILALGELAWLCLLSDRYGFRETELAEFERRYPGLVARELGLLYKEESVKRLKPQHEYCFLHKTFQEYVAAAYITEKLVNQQFNVFERIDFYELETKYPQVFIFVSGMLSEKATVLFTQIGEELKKSYDWNWSENCSEEDATFFIESFNESGHAEQMAATLCQIIPFPKVITLQSLDDYNPSFGNVLKACKSFSNLQTPVELYGDTCVWEDGWLGILSYIESFLQPKVVSFVCGRDSLTSFDADRLCKWFCATNSLSEFTLKCKYDITRKDCDLLAQIGHGLASVRTLTKVTFSLPGYAYREGYFNALETGLATLTSVVLELYGPMKYTATRALQNFLANKSLNSVSLRIVGGVHDLLVTAVSEALVRQTVLKSLDLHLGGPLSSSSASFLEKALMENRSLNTIRLCVYGELPGNWHSVVENLRLAKKSLVCCSIYPNTFNNVANVYFRPVLVRKGLNVKQHLTVNVWGEMKCQVAEALYEVLAPSSITVLTLNVRGNLTSEVSNSIARCLEENKTLSSLSINLWGELTTEGSVVPPSLPKNSRVQLNVHDLRIGPGESNNILVITTDNSAALRVFFTNVKDRRKEKVTLTINNDSYVTKEWTRCLGDALAENPSLTALDLTVNSCVVDADLGENLGNSLLQSSSLTSLSLTFNFSNLKEGWECKLGDCLIKMASLTSLSLKINGDGEWNRKDCLCPTLSLDDGEENQENCLSPTKLSNVLAAIHSLSSLSIVVHSDSMCFFWDNVVGDCLMKCTSLKKLSLTFNYGKSEFGGFSGLEYGLMATSSLNALCVAIFINGHSNTVCSRVLDSLKEGLSLNSSVTTLTLTVSVAADEIDDTYLIDLGGGLLWNTSITTLNVTMNECGDGESHIPQFLYGLGCFGLFGVLANNTSVTTFNLTLNSNKTVSDFWLRELSYALKKNTSLTTLRLKVNNHCATGESRLYDFSKLLIESGSLSLLELDISFYGRKSGCHNVLIQ